MLVSLHVKNLVLIAEEEVEFGKGLNILSGETGAGKSILIGSVNLALGERAGKEVIRNGAEYAMIELLFMEDSLRMKSLMEELELPWENGSILISRKIQPTRSIFRINGESVTTKQVKQLAELLLDIHGQHEHQSLLHKKKHREIVDEYAGEDLAKLLPVLEKSWRELSALQKELEEAQLDDEQRRRELSLAEFEVREIIDARLQCNEDEELEKIYKKMTNSRKIMESIATGCRATGAAGNEGAAELIGHALRNISQVLCYDEELSGIVSQLEEIDALLSDFNRELTDYQEKLAFSETDYEETERRLNTINHLKGKYGRTIEDILTYREKREQERDRLADFDAYKENLAGRLRREEEAFDKLCGQASAIRKQAASALEKELKQALSELNFQHVEFKVSVESGKKWQGASGYDDVEFMISTNVGEEVRPLSMVASGGELSRIMLALKTVLAGKDEAETLIFDEIDAGISGRTAWKVSEKLGVLSRKRQVICITHLPQIAAMADFHFYIEKNVEEEQGMTKTTIALMKEEERVKEIARMLGGDEISEAAMQNAKELMEMAKKAIL